jgi:hypothetical protein
MMAAKIDGFMAKNTFRTFDRDGAMGGFWNAT